jgi:hypothetical protein
MLENMFLSQAGKDKDVVEVDEHELVQHIPENVIDQGLEHSRSIGQTKRHHQVFIVSASSVEGCLPLVTFPYPYQVVGIPQV